MASQLMRTRGLLNYEVGGLTASLSALGAAA